jgi:hypothetical protein
MLENYFCDDDDNNDENVDDDGRRRRGVDCMNGKFSFHMCAPLCMCHSQTEKERERKKFIQENFHCAHIFIEKSFWESSRFSLFVHSETANKLQHE